MDEDAILPLVGCLEEITVTGTYRCGPGMVTAYIPTPADDQPKRFDIFDERGALVEQRAEIKGQVYRRRNTGGYWSEWRRHDKPFVW